MKRLSKKFFRLTAIFLLNVIIKFDENNIMRDLCSCPRLVRVPSEHNMSTPMVFPSFYKRRAI